MRVRLSGSTVTLAMAAAAVGAALSVPVTRTQAQAPAASGTGLKTPWGEPDLQGIWTDEFDTPLQRPARFANQEFFTAAQRQELDKERAAHYGSDPRQERGTALDVGGAYNTAFLTIKHTGARTSLVVDPPDGRIPPLMPAAQKRGAADREFRPCPVAGDGCVQEQVAGVRRRQIRSDALAAVRRTAAALSRRQLFASQSQRRPRGRRVGGPLPAQRAAGVRKLFRREFSPHRADAGRHLDVLRHNQGQGWQRNIVMNGSPHLPAAIRQWYGDLRGHWEGNTLVIDVTNFSPKTDFQGSRENLHLVERWRRTGPKTLDYEVTIEDPTVWARPWTVKQEFAKESEEENRIYYEPRCIEGNLGLPGLLHGRRVEERAYAEGRGPDPRTVDNVGGVLSVATDPLQ